jgi:hypothetical protein
MSGCQPALVQRPTPTCRHYHWYMRKPRGIINSRQQEASRLNRSPRRHPKQADVLTMVLSGPPAWQDGRGRWNLHLLTDRTALGV